MLALGGCSTNEPSSRPVSATALLETRFPNRARTLRHDDARWLVEWLAQQWPDRVNARELRRAIEEQREGGYSIEEALLAVLPETGLWTHAGYGSLSELATRLSSGCPVVVQLSMPAGKRRARRFAIISSMEERTLKGQFSDGELLQMLESEFLSAWSPYRNWMLTAHPPEQVKWTMRSPERVSLIRYYDRLGKHSIAEALAAEALAADPRNADLAGALGTRALQRGKVEEAEALLRRALALNEGHVAAANNLAYLLGQQGRNLDEALTLARRAMLAEPANPRILHTYGFLQGQLGKWHEARLDLERAWQRASVLPVEARIQVGTSLMRAYLRTDAPHLACDILVKLRATNPGILLPADIQASLDLAGACR